MSSEKFREEELKFLREQHDKAKEALRVAESGKVRLEAQLMELSVLKQNVWKNSDLSTLATF
jgi:hypothetical protein